MPEENHDLKKGEQANSSGADQTGNNNDNGKGSNNDQQNKQNDQGKKGQSDSDGEETVTIKKSEWEKTNSDLKNYREGLLNKKAADRAGGAGGTGGQSAGESQPIDTKKVEEISTAVASKVLSQRATKDANKRFLEVHPEYMDDKQWQEFMTHYHSKRGTTSPEDILEDFEDAVLTHKRASGQLETYLNEQAEKRRREAALAAAAESARDAGSVGAKTSGGEARGTQLTPEGEAMAKSFGHDPKKVAKVGSEDRMINVIKQK